MIKQIKTNCLFPLKNKKCNYFYLLTSTVSVPQQQKMGENKGVVMDGRDIGTVVFPSAELKIFMTASPEIRAQRRYNELISRGDKVDFDDVLQNVMERDYIDTHREDSPLIKAKDAIEIDNSNMTLEEQFAKILHLVEKVVSSKG